MHALNIRKEKNKNRLPCRKRIKLNPIQIQISQINCRIPLKRLEKIGKTVLQEESWENGGVLSVVMVNDSEIQELNSRFLGKAYPTDVIAFPLESNHDEIWGEIYISTDRAREQAERYHVSFSDEVTRLFIHGILHLLGYDDQKKSEKSRMKKKEDYYLHFFKSDNRQKT